MTECVGNGNSHNKKQLGSITMRFCQDNELNKKAEEIVCFCRDSVMKMYERDDITGIILTGSFSREEGSIIKSPDNVFYVLGDVEFMIVLPSKEDFVEKYRRLKEISKHIANDLLERRIHCDVDLTPVTNNYFENVGPVIFNIELKENGKVIYAETDFLEKMPKYKVTDIPKDDAFNLLSNRIIEQLILYQNLVSTRDVNFLQAAYQLTKLYLDIGGSLLAFSGNYETTYAKRVVKLKGLSEEAIQREQFAGIDMDNLYSKIREYTEVKLYPKYEDFFPSEMNHRQMREYLLAKIRAAVHDVRALWMWEIKDRYSLNEATDFHYIIKELKRHEYLSKKLKGWAKLVLLHLKYKKVFSPARIMKLFFLGSPHSLVNVGAAQTYFAINRARSGQEETARNLQRNIRSIIPVLYIDQNGSDEGLSNSNILNIIRNWENYIKNF